MFARAHLLKMDKVTGRTDDMLIINGVNVFPSQIEALLSDIREIELQYLLAGVRKNTSINPPSASRASRKCLTPAPARLRRLKEKSSAIAGESWASMSAWN